jgi:hypothetical protein
MKSIPRPNVQLLVGMIVGVMCTVAIVFPGFAQTVATRPKLGTTAVKTVPQIDLMKLGRRPREFYNEIRMPIESLDFSPTDTTLKKHEMNQRLNGAGSAFLVMCPQGIPEFDSLPDFEFRLYDSIRGQHYKPLLEKNPGPYQGTSFSTDPLGRECYWFESEDKHGRVMLALDRKSRTIKASYAAVTYYPKGKENPVRWGELCGVFALRMEVSYHAKKVTYVGDAVFRLHDIGATLTESEPLDHQAKHFYYRGVY